MSLRPEIKPTQPRGAGQPAGVGLSGPYAAFFGGSLAALTGWVVAQAILPAGIAMPVAATTFLAFGGTVAFLAWRQRGGEPARITYFDAGGALVLIGCFAAAAVDFDQLMPLLESRPRN